MKVFRIAQLGSARPQSVVMKRVAPGESTQQTAGGKPPAVFSE
jgi:hypothetical protein